MDHLQKAVKYDQEKESGAVPFPVPTERACAEMERPSYAKATCTSYPGRIVCQLGRYTFVINNGEHKMNPEIIERFAAMVYHRSQEGDADFDVSVDIPVKINEDYFVPPQKIADTTTPRGEEMRYPIFVECSPIPDDRKMCNPPYNPTEITYSCKRRELGYGGYAGGHEKRMVISVDSEGTVSAGDLVLPYNALIERRMKRQKNNIPGKTDLLYVTPSGADNKLYSDICSLGTKGWCPTVRGTECPPSCRTDNQTLGNECAAIDGASPTVAGVQLAPAGGIVPGVQPQGPPQANLAHQQGSLPLMKGEESQLYAVSNLPPPEVRVYSDICLKSTDFPWCPMSYGDLVQCSIPTCVTLDPCLPKTTQCRQRREQSKEKRPALLSRHLQNRMRKIGPKRIFRKRKRQAHVASFHFFSKHETGKDTTAWWTSTPTKPWRKLKQTSVQCTIAPECTLAPECTTTTECIITPENVTSHSDITSQHDNENHNNNSTPHFQNTTEGPQNQRDQMPLDYSTTSEHQMPPGYSTTTEGIPLGDSSISEGTAQPGNSAIPGGTTAPGYLTTTECIPPENSVFPGGSTPSAYSTMYGGATPSAYSTIPGGAALSGDTTTTEYIPSGYSALPGGTTPSGNLTSPECKPPGNSDIQDPPTPPECVQDNTIPYSTPECPPSEYSTMPGDTTTPAYSTMPGGTTTPAYSTIPGGAALPGYTTTTECIPSGYSALPGSATPSAYSTMPGGAALEYAAAPGRQTPFTFSTKQDSSTQSTYSTKQDSSTQSTYSTKQERSTPLEYSTKKEIATTLQISQSRTRFVGLEGLGFNRMPLFKREMRRWRKKPLRIKWPNVSRERYILE
ncbi:uncharacterized protein [Halyomorpha halys]|nr:uncharacterized protein LOC106692534 isoform X2 [Halyomorpha halys]